MTTNSIILLGTLAALAAAAAAPLAAQTPAPEIVACYDAKTSSAGKPQGSGIVYRIQVPGVVNQQACVDQDDVQFSWTIRHGALTDLGSDDHRQYLLAEGARAVTKGFAVTGGYPTFAAIPATGAGTRFMWSAGKAALRAGHIDESHAALWDDAAIGVGSTALGFNSNASAAFSFACCAAATASNQFAMVLGSNSAASGWAATAIGNSAIASGDYSTAIGFQANTNGMSGATVFADAQGGPPVRATAPNSFVARAQRVWFGTSGDQPTNPAGYFTVDGLIASTTDGFKFPDGTVQSTAATGGVSGTPSNTPNTLVQRDANGGFAAGPVTVDGSFLARHIAGGGIPGTGAGERLMWYAGKSAFRAGGVTGDQWDDANVGNGSTAMGVNTIASAGLSTAMGANTTASGVSSTAMGDFTTASGSVSTAIGSHTTASGGWSTAMGRLTTATADASTAMGQGTTASGMASTAMGWQTIASGSISTAMGLATTASGDRSTAMGQKANTNGQAGSFVYGDNSTAFDVSATAPNQFVVRAAGGTIFYSNSDLSGGVTLAPGGGAWESVSDVNRKEHFRDVDGEDVLGKIARMPIRGWNYKAQAASIRHLGPTAQDFYAAFRLGESDTTITTTDIDGVNLLAVQALERRTREQAREIEALRAELAALRAEVAQRRP
jgi:hypothetical protein